MNKRHWNTITVNGDVPDAQLLHWILHSYELVLANLPKKIQSAIAAEKHDAA